jgi:hypothetical protein
MNERRPASGVDNKTPLNFQPKTKADHLALKIARAFREESKLPLYRVCCENFDEETIRKAFAKVMTVPDDKIRKSRSALFAYLLKKYAKRK